MVDEGKLSAVLSEFARTLATDFPIQGILGHLVERIVEVLPVTGAGVTLISAGMAPRYVAASDASALRYERLQAEIREGPCVLAYESGDAVAVPDLRSDDRFPNFGPVAVRAGLTAVSRPGDTLARISGDEFVFVCEGLHHISDAEVPAERVVEAFDEPFVLVAPGLTVTVAITASVGVAFADAGQEVSEQLVIDADLAMYACRRDGARHQIVDVQSSSPAGDRANLKEDLRAALERDELAVAYQPIVRSSDGLVVGMEALLRWTHPDRGPVPPPAIVALAETSELIDDVGAWVLERSCRDRGRWLHDHPGSPLDLAVNVSSSQLMRAGFRTTVEEVLSRSGLDPTALVLEVTESIFIEDGEYARTVLSD